MWFKFIDKDGTDLRVNMNNVTAYYKDVDSDFTFLEKNCAEVVYSVRQTVADIDKALSDAKHSLRLSSGW